MDKHEEFNQNTTVVRACQLTKGVNGCANCREQKDPETGKYKCTLFHELTMSYAATFSSYDCWMGDCCFNFKSDQCTISCENYKTKSDE